MCDRYFLLDKKLAIFQGTAMILILHLDQYIWCTT